TSKDAVFDTSGPPPLKEAIEVPPRGLAGMSPANFGMVMATGIVSLAAHLLGHPTIANSLFLLNNVLFGVLCILTVLRAWCYPRYLLADLVDQLRGPTFFTTVAAAGVLASQFIIMRENTPVGEILWGIALALWALLTY